MASDSPERCFILTVFNLNKLQKEICRAADDFARGELGPEMARDLDRRCEFPRSVWQKAADLGFVGLHYAEADGGGGLGMMETVLVAEALSRRDASLAMAMMLPGLSIEYLAASGNQDLKALYLPQVTEGRFLIGAALDDLMPLGSPLGEQPEFGCRWVGEDGLLTGAKRMVINAGCADALVVAAGPAEGPSMDGQIDILLVKTDLAGVKVDARENMLGLRVSETAQVLFDNVRVPRSHRIALEKPGSKRMAKVMGANWLLLAGMALGVAQGALDRSIGYIKQRSQFARRIGRFQVLRHKIAQMATAVSQARCLAYGVAGRWSQPKFDPADAAMAKWTAGEAALAASYEAIQLHGGYGYMTEYDVERYYREAKALTLICGNQGLLQDQVAHAVIGRVK